MLGLDLAFRILSILGFWMPPNWQKKKKLVFFYKLYSSLIVCCICAMVSLQAMLFVTNEMNFQFFVDILFTFLLSLSFCIKGTTLLSRRHKIIGLKNMLKETCCLPTDSEEYRMQKNADDINKKFTLFYHMNTQTALFLFVLAPFFHNEEDRKLPYQIWLPRNWLLGSHFWITLFMEYGMLIPPLLLNAHSDNLVFGHMLQASNQFDFIKHRIRRLCDVVENEKSHSNDHRILRDYELDSLKKCVEHHHHIVKFSKALTETFDLILMEIYFGSVLVMSVIVYEFSLGSSSLIHKIKSAAYFMCMALEIFCYCWYGNELALKSSEFGINDHKTNWIVLSKESKKMLRFMAIRSTHATVISFRGVITFNLASFKTIMKVTYSSFNLMKKLSS